MKGSEGSILAFEGSGQHNPARGKGRELCSCKRRAEDPEIATLPPATPAVIGTLPWKLCRQAEPGSCPVHARRRRTSESRVRDKSAGSGFEQPKAGPEGVSPGDGTNTTVRTVRSGRVGRRDHGSAVEAPPDERGGTSQAGPSVTPTRPLLHSPRRNTRGRGATRAAPTAGRSPPAHSPAAPRHRTGCSSTRASWRSLAAGAPS